MEISGRVIGGGDTTLAGLLDGRRKFEFQVQTAAGDIINLAYTAYPPSPFGDRQMEKIRLSFHEGTIQSGHLLKARGAYDEAANTLVVAEEGDFIETGSGA